MSSEITIGSHRLVREAEDVFAVYFGGSPTEKEMRGLMDAQEELSAGKPFFLLLDFTRVETITADVRKAVGEATQRVTYKAIGMFGASFHMKVIGKLVNVAIQLFKSNPFPQEFFDTRQATLAWFEELRSRSATGGA